ncbi:DNA-binding transcriptional regulator, AcrR family [Ferrimonas sediminum]|uniref:DNA-binding transcriptional regulator, AcrR family n=1 Tax=Ferrimonas sediminum TaxID=718193 RepID=A0A1G8LTS7_9GAMM|nr:TetR/AcrR family transcriptional regulator [Ferrimonas sediminum]SDI59104.1 DNA-binding transcriptional regulator, AcrR family [Ferrimonas sediminum]
MGSAGCDRKSKKRCQILEAATELFMQNGLETTSMDEVAERAGVSKQTVYSHFGNKDDLFVHCIESRCSSHQMTPEGFDLDADPAEVLLDFAHRFSDMVLGPEARHIYCSCVRSAETHPELSELYYGAGPSRMQELMLGYLTQLNQRGILAIPNSLFAAQQLLLMLQTMDKMRGELGLEKAMDDQQRCEYLKQTVTLFLTGYRPPGR